jgi:hypothetical protein
LCVTWFYLTKHANVHNGLMFCLPYLPPSILIPSKPTAEGLNICLFFISPFLDPGDWCLPLLQRLKRDDFQTCHSFTIILSFPKTLITCTHFLISPFQKKLTYSKSVVQKATFLELLQMENLYYMA